MKISAESDSPYYRPETAQRKFKAFLDGVEMPKTVFADTEAGEIHVLRRNADGSLWVNEETMDVETIVYRGKVEVVWRESGAPVVKLPPLEKPDKATYLQELLLEIERLFLPEGSERVSIILADFSDVEGAPKTLGVRIEHNENSWTEASLDDWDFWHSPQFLARKLYGRYEGNSTTLDAIEEDGHAAHGACRE